MFFSEEWVAVSAVHSVIRRLFALSISCLCTAATLERKLNLPPWRCDRTLFERRTPKHPPPTFFPTLFLILKKKRKKKNMRLFVDRVPFVGERLGTGFPGARVPWGAGRGRRRVGWGSTPGHRAPGFWEGRCWEEPRSAVER